MKLKLNFDKVDKASADVGINQAIGQWARQHLEPLLAGPGMQEVELAATASKHTTGNHTFSVKLHIHLPKKRVIVARAEDKDANKALHKAEDRLLRQFQHHLDRLRHQFEYKRKVRRQQLRELKAQIAELPEETIQSASTHMEQLLPRLEQIVRREMAYLRNSGALTGDYPTVQDVIDEAVAAVTVHWRTGESGDKLLQHLLREAFKILDREVAINSSYGASISLESPPERDAEEVSEAMVEEEIYEYYQPDEVLKLSDVLPDESTMPPETELEEAQNVFALDTMTSLPVMWRRALMLSKFEQMTVADIAEILEVSLAQIEKWLEHAHAFLDEHLRQAGFTKPME